MTLDELKSDWQGGPAKGGPAKSNAEIQQTISRQTSSVFSKTKRKALIETIAFLILLLVFMTGLDPERNPTWVNIILLLAVGAGIFNNVWLYRSLPLNPSAQDLTTSLHKARKKLEQQMLFAGVFSAFFFGSTILFLTLRVPLTSAKAGWVILLLIVSIGLRTGVELWRWRNHIRQIDQSLHELAG